MDTKQKLAALLKKTGEAHHQAFIETNGEDPEWPLWYAKHLQQPLSDLLEVSLTQSRIVYELIRMDSLDLKGKPWNEAFAAELIQAYLN